MKKYYSPQFFFLLVLSAFFLLPSCQTKTEKQIRAEVEKELMSKIDALLQPPPNVLSANDSRLVAEQFKTAKFEVGIEKTLLKLPSGTEVSFLFDKNGDYNLYTQFGGKKEVALTLAYLPAVFDERFIKPIRDCYLSPPPNCQILNLPRIPIEIACVPAWIPDPLCNDSTCIANCQGSSNQFCAWNCKHTLCPLKRADKCFPKFLRK